MVLIKKLTANIIKLVSACYSSMTLRYLFYGGLTTLVNIVAFFILRRLLGVPREPANMLAVFLALMFAYFVNSRLVFKSKAQSFQEHFAEFVKFMAARAFTVVIEIGGLYLLAGVLGIDEMISKVALQFIVVVLNYFFSKFLIFR